MEKNTKGFKAFLQDAKAVSPAIATLILIVVAAVAAAAIGVMVQSSQGDAGQTLSDKSAEVEGVISIKGSTTVLPINQLAAVGFMAKNPSYKVEVAGGGSTEGRMYAYMHKVDIGASSAIWPDTDTVTDGVTVPGRGLQASVVSGGAVIQDAGASATVWETKIGTGMLVIGGNINTATAGVPATGINVLSSAPGATGVTGWNATTSTVFDITYNDLRALYIAGTGTYGGVTLEAVQRQDPSGTEETFADWLGAKDSTTKQLNGSIHATIKQGNQGIRDYVGDAPATASSGRIGFVDVGFAKGGANGHEKVLAAKMNAVPNGIAGKETKGVDGKYDTESKAVSALTSPKGLARDLFYYSYGVPKGAVKMYLDYVMSPDGQEHVKNAGFFSV